jgi:hypothetical protein
MTPTFFRTRMLLAVLLLAVVSACGKEPAAPASTAEAQPEVQADVQAPAGTEQQPGERQPAPPQAPGVTATAAGSDPVMDVYKSPTCQCCEKWIDHVHAQGFRTSVLHPADLDTTKDKLGVLPAYRSCHTAVTKDGYVFEGHVPAKFIRQFLAEKPEGAIGLAVPGMPAGSPGMEVGDTFMPYEVLLLKMDGSASRYAFVGSPADQAH